MEREEFGEKVKLVKVESINDGKYQMTLIVNGDLNAHLLYKRVANGVLLSYVNNKNNKDFYLNFELADDLERFMVNCPVDAKTLNWLNWIDDHKLISLQVQYLHGDGNISSFDGAVLLRT